MTRRSLIGGLSEVCAMVPWYVALAMGAGLYVLFSHLLPLVVPGKVGAVVVPAMSILGYVLGGSCAVGVLLGFLRRREERRLYDRQSCIDSIRALSWREFEHFITESFRRGGFTAQTTRAGADGGVDIVLRKSGRTYFVQCKHGRNRRVGVAPIRELSGVIASEQVAGGYVVCSGTFTDDARAFARKVQITLIDGKVLAERLNAAKVASPPVRARSEFCPRCGSALVVRTAAHGRRAGQDFLGCASFPSCRYSKSLA
ncbi:MAG: restriction endonuclease [Gemmatimonadales bacterium]